MTFQIGLLLLIILVAVVLFSLDQFRADIIALGILLALSLTGLIPPGETFAGFGSDTAAMIFGLLVLTAAVTRTGVIDYAGRRLLRAFGDKPQHLLPAVITRRRQPCSYPSFSSSAGARAPHGPDS
jgi:Na+/H+ antiporter NhaD/arsenite permease-like protein